jgi:hypothetical protein
MADLLDDPKRLSLIGRAYYEPAIAPVLDALLDRALALASTPMAMVSIVGAHTQAFRAHRGLPSPWNRAGRMPRP